MLPAAPGSTRGSRARVGGSEDVLKVRSQVLEVHEVARRHRARAHSQTGQGGAAGAEKVTFLPLREVTAYGGIGVEDKHLTHIFLSVSFVPG